MNQANIATGASIDNRFITPPQINTWSTYIASLPESLCVMQKLSEIITLPMREASSYSIPVYSELSLEASLSPLARGALDERIAQIKSTNLNLECQEYGITILLFSNLVYQSVVSISGVASMLLANASARLTETLAINTLRSVVPQNIYSCSKGKNTKNPTEMTVQDLIHAKAFLEKSKTKRFNQYMLKGSDQVGTLPVPHSYAMLMSIDSKNAFEITLSEKPEFAIRPEQSPSVSEYSDCYAFTIPLAGISCVISTEYTNNSSTYSDYIIGKDSMYIALNSPLKGGLSIRSSQNYAYGRNSAVDFSQSFAAAVIASRTVLVLSSPV